MLFKSFRTFIFLQLTSSFLLRISNLCTPIPHHDGLRALRQIFFDKRPIQETSTLFLYVSMKLINDAEHRYMTMCPPPPE